MSTERALLEAIAKDLPNDVPRRAWADWLTSQGNAWGEFVHRSLDLAHAPKAEHEKRKKELAKLARAHAKEALGAAAKFFERKEWGFERGLPKYGAAIAQQLVKTVDEVALRTPGATMHLTDLKPKHIAALAPHFTAWSGGDMCTEGFDDAATEAFCSSGLIDSFWSVRLDAALGASGAQALARRSASLHSLMLGKVEDLSPLFAAAAPKLSRLTVMTSRATAALRGYALKLDSLSLTAEDFDDGDVDLLLAAPAAQQLERLYLGRSTDAPTKLTSAGAVRLIRGLSRLQDFSVGGTFGLTPAAAEEILAVLEEHKQPAAAA